MSDDPLKPTRAPEPEITGGVLGGRGGDIPPTTAATRFGEPDDPDDDPTPALACLDCEAVWVAVGDDWAYCPRCGGELDQLEVADE